MIEFNYKLYSKVILFLLGVSPLVWNANPASAITDSLEIDNTSFTVDTIGDNAASGDLAIDNTEFGDIFADGDTFLLLGATSANANIAASSPNVNATATFANFEISSDNVSDGSLNFSFDWAFAGDNDALDNFFVGIGPTGGSVTNFVTFQASYGSGTFDQSIDISGLTPGNYDLVVSLTESTGPGNSAAGFDNIAISSVPFEFSPALGLFLVGGLFGGSSYLKRKKAAKIDLK